ncbi:hypothetical protein KMZ15_05160 [Mycoavidus sp. HKI]|uniref:phage tail fiber protein n=1 Tax=Mycoavidus sp. HKI TaxID=2840467 RepID=UPI001CBD610E|nr:hypothetical protein [Mycoavidus sp. HKI]UAW63488.1 hypothetical protein KMZ15_05160 [Mycoavidus sp. HKI]
MNNISGFGLSVQVLATVTFPIGFTVTEFADDGDPFDIPSIQIKDTAMGLNGHLIAWSKPSPISITLNLLANSDGDKNMARLLERNRAGSGKIITRDVITMVATYPDQSTMTFTNGVITGGMTANSVASAGRMKSKPYTFVFENRIGTL